MPTGWAPAILSAARQETATARTLQLSIADWPGHLAGQHLDVRLTAEDGYRAERSYSIASAPGGPVELTVQAVDDGEVSPFLVHDLAVGDTVEVRGPLGGWFVWRPTQLEPVLLVAGGSGLVPLMAMLRAHRQATASTPMRLLYSVRTPDDVLYRDELADAVLFHTRRAPEAGRPPRRLGAADLAQYGFPVDDRPTCYLCGPTAFVEHTAGLLVELGHAPARIRTERFG
ncbi:MAG TPA: ferredoxin reductase [Jatrophihabitans sp.]